MERYFVTTSPRFVECKIYDIYYVTQEHIRKGKRKSNDCCPVVLACNDARGGITCKMNSSKMIVDKYPDVQCMDYIGYLTQETLDIIKHYDETGEMEPFSFTIGFMW